MSVFLSRWIKIIALDLVLLNSLFGQLSSNDSLKIQALSDSIEKNTVAHSGKALYWGQ